MRIVPLLAALSGLAAIGLATTASAQPIDLTGVSPCARASNLIKKDAEPGTTLIYLELCKSANGSTERDRAGAIELQTRIRAELQAAGYVQVTVEAAPAIDGARGFIDTLGDVPFPVPATVLVPPGSHRIGAIAPGHHGVGQQVTVSKGGRSTTITLNLEKKDLRRAASSEVDFSDDPQATTPTSSDDLPAAEHDELLNARYRRGINARGGTVAQSERRTGIIGLGGVLGVSMGSLGGDGAPKSGARVGLAAAVLVAYRINGPLVLLPEIGFAQRGADGATIEYLSIPMRLGYLRRLGPIAVHGAAGPDLAIAVSSALPAPAMMDAPSAETMDLGLSAGMGVHLPAGGGALVIDLYARIGFTSVIGGSSARDRSASLRAGYMF